MKRTAITALLTCALTLGAPALSVAKTHHSSSAHVSKHKAAKTSRVVQSKRGTTGATGATGSTGSTGPTNGGGQPPRAGGGGAPGGSTGATGSAGQGGNPGQGGGATGASGPSGGPLGTIASFTSGVLTVTLADGDSISGQVTAQTQIGCGPPPQGGQGAQQGPPQGGSSSSCTTAELTAGAVVGQAAMQLTGQGLVFVAIGLCPSSSGSSSSQS